MGILEDLKKADDWSLRYGLWDKLFVGDNLFQGLLQLDPSSTDDVAATIEQCNKDAQEGDKRPEWEWITAVGLITCAQIADLTERTPERLLQLLLKLNPQAQVTDRSDSDWQQFVRTSLYQFPWPKPLNAEWAWDAVTAFWKDRRKVLRSVQMTILLVEGNLGTTADLTLVLIGEGQGTLYPDPETMSFVLRGDTFLQAEQNAIAFVRKQGLWPKTEDVRWKITRKSHKPILELDGGSAGGAFALGIAKLMTGEL